MPEAIREGLTLDGWERLPFGPFRENVTIRLIRPFEDDQPGVALLKYEAGASVPRHRHEGLETILVLDGVQSTSSATTPREATSSTWREPSTQSDQNRCVVLIQWDRPVTILDAHDCSPAH